MVSTQRGLKGSSEGCSILSCPWFHPQHLTPQWALCLCGSLRTCCSRCTQLQDAEAKDLVFCGNTLCSHPPRWD